MINDVLDTDAWTAMTAELAMLQATPQLLIERRNLYEEMLGHYPTAVRAYTVYQFCMLYRCTVHSISTAAVSLLSCGYFSCQQLAEYPEMLALYSIVRCRLECRVSGVLPYSPVVV